MPSLTLVNSFFSDLFNGEHDFTPGTGDSFKWALTNTAPTTAVTQLSGITEIGAPGGYTAGGNAVTVASASQTGGVFTLVTNSTTFTAGGGDYSAFRYMVLYNDTSASDLVVGWLDYGAAYTLTSGNSFVIQGATLLQGPV